MYINLYRSLKLYSKWNTKLIICIQNILKMQSTSFRTFCGLLGWTEQCCIEFETNKNTILSIFDDNLEMYSKNY